jgi:hypothetical protein
MNLQQWLDSNSDTLGLPGKKGIDMIFGNLNLLNRWHKQKIR